MTNDHVSVAIDAYLDARVLPVPHAILITGAWGSGKTHFLKEIYEPNRLRARKKLGLHHTPFLFVSLFGATSAAEVELRIYKTANPGEAIVGAVAGTVALGIAEFFRVKDAAKGAVDKLGKRAIKRLNDYIFVFDDLERVEPDAFLEIMALVNSFVADHDKRVILVADEDVILRSSGMDKVWNEQCEKIVGRRAKIEADIATCLASSLKDLSSSTTTDIALKIESELASVARYSTVQNLRSLKWAIHNAIALGDALSKDPAIPRSHIAEAIKIVFASTLWLRSGLIKSAALHRVPGAEQEIALRSLSKNATDPVDPSLQEAQEFAKNFANLSTQNPAIKYEFITALEESGTFEAANLIEWVKSQFGFGTEHREPAWRRLWYAYERPISETEAAIKEVAIELETFQHTEPGEILHIAGLSLRHERVSDLRLTNSVPSKHFFIQYIDNLLVQDRLPPIPEKSYHDYYDSHQGLGFTERHSPEFKEIADYLYDRCNAAFKRSLKGRAARILREANAGNPNALMDFIQLNTDLGTNPILSEFSPEEFAEVATLDFPQLRFGARVLAYRYHQKHRSDPILSEIPWARQALAAIHRRVSKWEHPYDELGAKFLDGIIRHYEQGRDADLCILE